MFTSLLSVILLCSVYLSCIQEMYGMVVEEYYEVSILRLFRHEGIRLAPG